MFRTLDERIDKLIRRLFTKALTKSQGNVQKASDLLHMDRSRMIYHMKRLSIYAGSFKPKEGLEKPQSATPQKSQAPEKTARPRKEYFGVKI